MRPCCLIPMMSRISTVRWWMYCLQPTSGIRFGNVAWFKLSNLPGATRLPDTYLFMTDSGVSDRHARTGRRKAHRQVIRIEKLEIE